MNKGFSLVELIVVIAIMAILVGVAVPVYTSYIEKAENNVLKQYADELERAINTVCIDMKAGLTTDTAATDGVIPTTVVVSCTKNGNTYATSVVATGANSAEANQFEEMLEDVITLDDSSEYTFTFTVSAQGVVTEVAGLPN